MQLPPTSTAAETAVLFVLEVIVFLLGGLLLISGIVLAGSTATMVGRVPGYGLGLTLIAVAAITIVGAGNLHFHRRRIEDRDADVATILEEIRKIDGRVDAFTRIEEKRFDQLASRRNGHS